MTCQTYIKLDGGWPLLIIQENMKPQCSTKDVILYSFRHLIKLIREDCAFRKSSTKHLGACLRTLAFGWLLIGGEGLTQGGLISNNFLNLLN